MELVCEGVGSNFVGGVGGELGGEVSVSGHSGPPQWFQGRVHYES